MTGRQRLKSVFDRQRPDRIPIWCIFPYESDKCYTDIYNIDSYKSLAEYARHNTDFIERYTINNNDIVSMVLFNHPEIEKLCIEENLPEYRRVVNTVRYGGIELSKVVTTYHGGRTVQENYVKDIEDIYKFMELPYEMPVIDLEPYRENTKRLGEAGLPGIFFEDAFSMFHHICSEEDSVLWAYTETNIVKEFLEFIMPRLEALYRQFLEGGVGEVFWLSGAEFLCEPLASRNIFHILSTTYNKRIVSIIRDFGKKTLLHCHGKIKNILPELAEICPDAIQPIEPHPMGDVTLREVREILGPDMILIGNIEYTALAESSEEEIYNLVKNAIEEGGPLNFILCPSCAPYEKVLATHTAENYIALIDSGLEYGRL